MRVLEVIFHMSNYFIDNTSELEQKYSSAHELISRAETLSDIKELIGLLHSVSPYKDSVNLLSEAYKLLEKEQEYQKALWIMNRAECSDDFKRLCAVLNTLGNYKDSRTLLNGAQKSLKKAEASENLRQRKKVFTSVICVAIFALLCFGGYKFKVWR